VRVELPAVIRTLDVLSIKLAAMQWHTAMGA
jgi:hypothetical protein